MYIYVRFRFPDPTYVFAPTLNILLWIVSKMLSNLLKNGEKCIEKCNFYIKYFDKIKCYADLVFSELKPETHREFFLALWYFSSSVTSFFKRVCAAFHWGQMFDFWSDPWCTSILHMCEQRRLWRDCVDAQAPWAIAGRLCDKCHNPMNWLNLLY